MLVLIDENYADYTLEDKIGEGNFGTVFKMRNNKNHKIYAVKRIKTKDDQRQKSEREIEIQAELKHSHIVRFHHYFTDSTGAISIFMEYCDSDLSKVFANESETDQKIKPYALKLYSQIILGLQYLHDKEVIHRDLKPENILLCKDADIPYCAKIGDFGLARIQDLNMTRDVGTPLYMAPELGKQDYSYSADVYSSGLIFFQLLANQKDGVLQQLRKEDCTEHVLMTFYLCLQGMKDLLKRLLDHDPQRRPKTAGKVQEELTNLEKSCNGRL